MPRMRDFIPSVVNDFARKISGKSARFAFVVNESLRRNLTTKKFLLSFPKFEVGHIHSRARCFSAAGFLLSPGNHMICTPPSQTPSVADRVKTLTGPFLDDTH
jgi:hypothetical protein